MANLVRIFWWLSADFSITIMYAAVFMVFCQFVLLYVWVSVKAANLVGQKYKETFWDWLDFQKYLNVIVGVTAALLASFVCFRGN